MIAKEILLLAARMRPQGFFGQLSWLQEPETARHGHPKHLQSRTIWQSTNCGCGYDKSWEQLTGHGGFWVPWKHLLQCDWWNCGSAAAHAAPRGLPGFLHPALLGCCRRVSWGEKCTTALVNPAGIFQTPLCQPVPASHQHLTRGDVLGGYGTTGLGNQIAACKYCHRTPTGEPQDTQGAGGSWYPAMGKFSVQATQRGCPRRDWEQQANTHTVSYSRESSSCSHVLAY